MGILNTSYFDWTLETVTHVCFPAAKLKMSEEKASQMDIPKTGRFISVIPSPGGMDMEFEDEIKG